MVQVLVQLLMMFILIHHQRRATSGILILRIVNGSGSGASNAGFTTLETMVMTRIMTSGTP